MGGFYSEVALRNEKQKAQCILNTRNKSKRTSRHLQQRLDSRVSVVVVVAGTSGGVFGPVVFIRERLAVCLRVCCIRGRTVPLEIPPPKVRVSVRGLIIDPAQEQSPPNPTWGLGEFGWGVFELGCIRVGGVRVD